MASPIHPDATELVADTSSHGFNLVGFVASTPFDACQPPGRRAADLSDGCGTIFLVGSGGGASWEHMRGVGIEMGEPRPGHHPINEYSAHAARTLTDSLHAKGIHARVTFPDDSPALNFMQLAELAGWGTISPVLGILLHPEFGPWVSIRAALLIDGQPFGDIGEEEHQPFQPCLSCQKPCVSACPASVFDGMGSVQLEVCANHRNVGNCRHGCDARRACPVGATSRYGSDEERFRHAYSLFTMRRHFGLTP